MRAAAALMVLLVFPVAGAATGERILGLELEGPLVGLATSVEGVEIATFELPEGYAFVYAAVEARRVLRVGAFIQNYLTLVSPDGESRILNHDNAPVGLYNCGLDMTLTCEDTWTPDAHRSHNIAAVPGEWSIRYWGANTASYTIGIYGVR